MAFDPMDIASESLAVTKPELSVRITIFANNHKQLPLFFNPDGIPSAIGPNQRDNESQLDSMRPP